MNNTNCVKFFFGRFQPPHSGHFDIIERTVRNNPKNCKIFVFISPKTSDDDLRRGTYGAYESEDRYPLTGQERQEIIESELRERGLEDDVEVMTNARTAQAAIKEIMRTTGVEPEDIDIMLGEDERGPFTKSFYGKPQLDTSDDKMSHPEKYVGMEIFDRNDLDVSATKIRNRLIELIIASSLDTEDVLDSIDNDSFLASVLPRNRESRKIIVDNYKRKMKQLGEKRSFGKYSILALGGKRGKRNKTKRGHKRSRRKSKKTRYRSRHRKTNKISLY